jgi:hypothetical protein
MAEPILTFAFSHDAVGDSPWGYNGYGGEDPNKNGWKVISPATDLVVFTGGGILGLLPTPTTFSGARDATIRPSTASYVIPQTYVEKDQMYIAQYCGHNAYRYAMAVYIKDHMTSDLYLEAWDDHSFSTTNLEILAGTPNSNNQSFVNAIRTTLSEPPWDNSGSPPRGWDGSDTGAAYLRGVENRIGLSNLVTITDDTVYYNMYIRLETDCSTFHALPVLGFRYLYT